MIFRIIFTGLLFSNLNYGFCETERHQKYFEKILINEELLTANTLRFDFSYDQIISAEDAINKTPVIVLGEFSDLELAFVTPIKYTVTRNGALIYSAQPEDFKFRSIGIVKSIDRNLSYSELYINGPMLKLGDKIHWHYYKNRKYHSDKGNWKTDLRLSTITKHFEYQLIVPSTINAQIESQGNVQMGRAQNALGDTVWRYAGTSPYVEESKEIGHSPYDDDGPAIFISTYLNWKDIGNEYLSGEAAAMREGLSHQQLLDIVGEAKTDRAIANNAYRWIQTNLSYDATYISFENLLRPRDIDKVFSTRVADCKEMVMVLKAVLSAKGIASQTVGVHTRSFRSPTIPSFAFNHVIVYVPSIDMYIDPSNTAMSFGLLSRIVYRDKVLKFGENQLETIQTPIENSVIDSVEHINIQDDGLVTSELRVTSTGDRSSWLVDSLGAQPQSKKSYSNLIKKSFSRANVEAASINTTDFRQTGGGVSLFVRNEFLDKFPTDNKFRTFLSSFPTGTGFGNVYLQMPIYQSTPRQSAIICGYSHLAKETVTYNLPEKYRFNPPITAKLAISNDIFKYEREIVVVKPNVIKVLRQLTAYSTKLICPASDYAAWLEFARKIIKDYYDFPMQIGEGIRYMFDSGIDGMLKNEVVIEAQ